MDSNSLLRILEKFQEIDPAMPLSAFQAFVWVATHEGRHQYDLEVYLGATNATASRSIAWWSEWRSYKDNRPGPGFIESFPDPEDKRYRIVRLTSKGQKFWSEVKKMGSCSAD